MDWLLALMMFHTVVIVATAGLAAYEDRRVWLWAGLAFFGNVIALAAMFVVSEFGAPVRMALQRKPPVARPAPPPVPRPPLPSGSPWAEASKPPAVLARDTPGSTGFLPDRCARCGDLPPPGAAFCPSCGAALGRKLTADIASEPLKPFWNADAPPPLPKETSTKAPLPKTEKKKAKPRSPIPGMIVLGVAGLFIWRACSGPDDPKPVAQSAPPPPATVSAPAASPAPVAIQSIAPAPEPAPPPAPPKPHMATIDPGATNPITPGGKLSKQLGKAWTARVNAAFVAAANRAARSPLCQEVRLTGYSFDRSEPRKHFSVFADCASGNLQERFYMTEAETKLETIPESVRQIVDRADGFMSCVNVVREKMKFPSTLDYSLWGSNTERSPYGEMGVSLSFTAKNSLGAELPYRASCIIDDLGVLLQSVKPR